MNQPPPLFSTGASATQLRVDEEDRIIKRIADMARLSCVFWLVLGILQICIVWTAIAGVWNIVASIMAWKNPERIRKRDPTIPKEYEGIVGLALIAVVNVVLGGVVGIFLTAFEYFIRDKVLSNAHLFRGAQSAPTDWYFRKGSSSLASEVDQQIRTLAKLRDDGLISEDEFCRKKRDILGI